MSATATTKTRRKRRSPGKANVEGEGDDGRPKSRRSNKRGTSEKQTAANRRNSEKSTGPRTAEGKRNSKYNALNHGMTARSVLLPGEKAEELAAHQQHLIDSFQPRHAVEVAIVERMALDIWRADRVERSAGLRIAERLRHEPLEKASKEQDEAIELGGRLFWQPSFPLPISKRSSVGKITEPQCAESPVHPHHPARLRLKLEQTLYGCVWLIARWQELSQQLYFNKLWLTADNFFMVRLLGKHAIDMADNLDVVRVFLCGLTLLSAPKAGPEREAFDWKDPLIKMLVTFDLENRQGIAESVAKQCEPFARRLAELPLAKLAPRDENHARSWLTGIIDQELRRLQDIRLYLQVVAQTDEAEAPARLAFETGPEGDRHRRYGLSAERLVIKRFGDFVKTRGQIVAGTFDPTEVELQDLLGSAAPSVLSCPLSVDIPHSGQTETLDRGEILTRSVSEEIGCGPSLTLRVSGGTQSEAYGSPLCSASGQGDPIDETYSPCDNPPAMFGGDLSAVSGEIADGCDTTQFLRNEAISPLASGPSSVADGEVDATETPGEPDQATPTNPKRQRGLPQLTRLSGTASSLTLRVRMPETSDVQLPARLLPDGISSVIDGALGDAIKRAITERAKEDVGAGIEWSGLLRELQAEGDRDFGVDRTPPGAAREV
jgi:hypothetical protein